MKNKEIAEIFYAFSEFLAMDDVPFKPRAYEKGAEIVESLEEDLQRIYKMGGIKALEKIPGIGKGMAEKIEEYFTTGSIKEYDALKKKIPVNFEELRKVEGLGPKKIKMLYTKLGVKDISSLKKAALSNKISKLPHFGTRSEEKILKGIAFHEKSGGRFLLGEAMPLARAIEASLRRVPGVKIISNAGSLRRMQSTVGDLDILVVARRPQKLMDYFVNLPEVEHVHSRGETKSSLRMSPGIDVDLRVVPIESYGAALQYFTGSKEHNVLVRKIAVSKGMKLNEYGLYKGKKRVAGETEESIYRALGLEFPIPELRQGFDELERKYSDIIDRKDIKGDLQTQTDWTDGTNSIEAMARKAKLLGHEYLAITDHTKSLAMTGGSDEKKLKRQMKEIDALNKKISGITILKGAEVNIMKDGSLDIDDETLEMLDVAGAAVHSHFNLTENEQTSRIMRAMENPHIDILFHPTGRVLKKRDPYAVDIKKLLRHARKTGTVMEIDAHPYRLDLKDEHIREGIEAKVTFSIDTDAHSIEDLSLLEYGVGQARRAGLKKGSVLNTLSIHKLKAFLSTPKYERYDI